MGVVLTGWYGAFAVAIVIIGIVVFFVGWILQFAGKIAAQASRVNANLGAIAASTEAIGDVSTVNSGLKDIAESCIVARQVLEANLA
ncbi:MAG: hypothetical protein ACRDZ8_13990 [Acidimicrobiales bacterium]